MGRELDEKCAVAMGWVKRYSPDPTIYAWEKPNGERMTAADLPMFSSRHIASGWLLDEIEQRGLQEKYVDALGDILWGGWGVNQPIEYDWMWDFLRATPEQRAQAFLRAIDAEL